MAPFTIGLPYDHRHPSGSWQYAYKSLVARQWLTSNLHLHMEAVLGGSLFFPETWLLHKGTIYRSPNNLL